MKSPQKYFKVDPWAVIEKGFDHKRSRISESMFCLANEFMGTRGYFEEGYSGDHLVGNYFNCTYESMNIDHDQLFKGMITRSEFLPNGVDWLHTRIFIGNERLDLAKSNFSGFVRKVDMKTGLLTREFIWTTKKGKKVKIIFQRFLSLVNRNMGLQRIRFKPLNFTGTVKVIMGLDFSILHEIAEGWTQVKESDSGYVPRGKCLWEVIKKGSAGGIYSIMAQTLESKLPLFSSFRIDTDAKIKPKRIEDNSRLGAEFMLPVKERQEAVVDRIAISHWQKGRTPAQVWRDGLKQAKAASAEAFDTALEQQREYWKNVWDVLDIEIDGDPELQQGLRFSLFQFHQNYIGGTERLNIPCKGLTAEVYYGWIFWDTETYCIPAYVFYNPIAAKKLLLFRYNTLQQAIDRAQELGHEGARYPFCTINGQETCGTWQHGDLEVHVGLAVFYALQLYTRMTQDKEFLYKEGIEMLLQISRFFADRGEFSPKTGEFGLYGVMGPDEYHMMVNHNCYTNGMTRKLFEYTLDVIAEMKRKAKKQYKAVSQKAGLDRKEINYWKKMAKKMRIPYDKKTDLYEQHEGYFDLPEVDVKVIPDEQIPIYHSWPYYKIFRYNMIKQPDFLLLPLFYSSDYSIQTKKRNFEYYEKRCIHESSLSPSIHSILASELGKDTMAYDFFVYMARLDLDNYNRNSEQGLHITAMSGAWLNMVNGFGGMRTDGDILSFNPSIPKQWKSYRFKVLYQGSKVEVTVDKKKCRFAVVEGDEVPVMIYGKKHTVTSEGVELKLKKLG
ncbi:MAG: family 65 glycosyl hydrolase [Chitinivibrionales bacterium]|nr:family 65 glycosyl hydrolase [Chitinivibrionales bacterium]